MVKTGQINSLESPFEIGIFLKKLVKTGQINLIIKSHESPSEIKYPKIKCG